MDTKQVIVMRTDLNMTKGKLVAQGSHASMAFITRRIVRQFEPGHGWYDTLATPLTDVQFHWLHESFTKITLKVNSEEELLAINDAAHEAGLSSYLITDDGRTMFNGVPTNTCIAIGPDLSERIDPITGHLRLL